MASRSASTIRRSRVEINRDKLAELELGLADGVFDIARAIMYVAESRAPDATPHGQGLINRGGAIAWVDSKRTHEASTDGRKPDKPRGFGVKRAGSRIVAVVGFGFPGMFQELGTVRHRAQPFLTPAAAEVIGDQAQLLLSKAMERRLRGERSPVSARIQERIAAAKSKAAAPAAGGSLTSALQAEARRNGY